MKYNDAIDAVITWVDGNDENHRKKRNAALRNDQYSNERDLKSGKENTRFVESGELLYCILSIRKFAPWIGKIYLVTDNQVPDFMDNDFQLRYDISIIDHTVIFRDFEWALPTFNTRSIEMALWRIPGLSDDFIYFNDDFVLTSPVDKSDFFNNGKIVLKGNLKPIRHYGPIRMGLNNLFSIAAKRFIGVTRSMHLLLQIRSSELAGFTNQYFRVPHVPYPVRKSTLENFFRQNPELFKKNVRYKFRSTEQFSAIFLADHLEIKDNNAVLKAPEGVMTLHGELDTFFILRHKLKRINQGKITFLSLQGFESFKKGQQESIKKCLDITSRLIGVE